MSWSITTERASREDFEAAVDAAVAQGQATEVIAGEIAEWRAHAKALGKLITRPYIVASGGGHVLEPGQDEPPQNWHEGVTISVTGYR